MSSLLVPRDSLSHADAIVVLTGNGWERTDFAVTLYKKGWAPLLLMVGTTGSRPSSKMAEKAKQLGVPSTAIETEMGSANTRQNAEKVLQIAKSHSWQKIILVTSPHHQLRAAMTFSKARRVVGSSLEMINYPPLVYGWLEKIESSRNPNKKVRRFWYLFSELYRIFKYRLKGDL
jgi:uncharacterized SAM-binding protein YcdF (DUF218 family)